MKDVLEEYLTDVEQLEVTKFVENKLQYEAVKKVLLMPIYHNGTLRKGEKADPSRNFALGLVSHEAASALSNETLGADLRATFEGIRAVETAFKKLTTIFTTDVKTHKVAKENKGR